MPQNIIKSYFLFPFLVLLLISCGTTKEVTDDATEKLEKIKDDVLIRRLDSAAQKIPDFFYTKLTANYKDNNDNLSFTTSVRMRADSAINATLSYARLPIYNSIVTPDSITLVDRRNKCYIQEGIEYFKKAFNVDFHYQNIEELLLGLPLGWDSEIDYTQIKHPNYYVIASEKRKNIQRMKSHNDGIILQYFIDTNGVDLAKTKIDSPRDSVSIEIEYGKRTIYDGYSIPESTSIHIKTPKNNIFATFKYKKTAINDPRVLYLVIPEKYDQCE